jgi:hypothetical protein
MRSKGNEMITRAILSWSVWLLVLMGTAFACIEPPYWTQWSESPQFIVIGTVEEISIDVFQTQEEFEDLDTTIIQIYNGGWINVEEVLMGASDGKRLQIAWQVQTKFDPPIAELLFAGYERDLKAGSRYIWVLWSSPPKWGEDGAQFYNVMVYGMYKRQGIEDDIAELLSK